MVLGSALDASSTFSSSVMPFLKALMPFAKSPISSEILPRPPNSSRPTASTMFQCQMLNEPMRKSSVATGPHGPAGPHGPFVLGNAKLGFQRLKNKAGQIRCKFSSGRKPLELLLLLHPLETRGKAKIEVARLERVLILAQGRIVGRQRHGESSRQPAIQQAGALELVDAGQIAY